MSSSPPRCMFQPLSRASFLAVRLHLPAIAKSVSAVGIPRINCRRPHRPRHVTASSVSEFSFGPCGGRSSEHLWFVCTTDAGARVRRVGCELPADIGPPAHNSCSAKSRGSELQADDATAKRHRGPNDPQLKHVSMPSGGHRRRCDFYFTTTNICYWSHCQT